MIPSSAQIGGTVALDFRHEHGNALRGRAGERGKCLSRAAELRSIDRGARQRQRTFEMPRRFRGQALNPGQPLAGGIA